VAKTLFNFDFESPLTIEQIRDLMRVTGMLISDVHNPYKDTPGKGWFAGNVSLNLEREQGREDAWFITAFTHDITQIDQTAVNDMRQRLRDFLPRIATSWIEKIDYPVLEEARR